MSGLKSLLAVFLDGPQLQVSHIVTDVQLSCS